MLTVPLRCRITLSIHLVTMVVLEPSVGPAAVLLAVIPAVISGWWSGLRGGLLSAAVLLGIDTTIAVVSGRSADVFTFLFVAAHLLTFVGGAAAGWLGKLHEALHQAATVLDASGDAILVVQARSGEVISFNATARELFGTPHLRPGTKLEALFETTPEPLLALSRGGTRRLARGADGSHVSVDVMVSSLPGRGEQHRVVALRDQSARVELEARLLQSERAAGAKAMEAQLHRANHLAQLGTMATSVGHDVNNPLTFVLVNLEELQEDMLSDLRDSIEGTPLAEHASLCLDEMSDLLSETLEGTRRIRDIVSELQHVARSQPSESATTTLDHLVDSAAKMARHAFGPTVTLERTGHIVGVVGLDASKLSQVLVNLLTNAAHAVAGRPDPRVTLRTSNDAQGVYIEVSDNGCGISSDHLERVFDAFFTTKPIGEGTGLGLSVCRSIIEGLGGALELTSEEGHGTSVHIRLPATAVVEAAEAPIVPTATHSGLTVLVVDDEPLVGRAIARLMHGWRVTTVHSAAEARQALARQRYDRVLCDIVMPGETGVDLYRSILQVDRAQAARFTFVTGGATDAETRAFVSAHPDRVIAKPPPFDLAHRLADLEVPVLPAAPCARIAGCPMVPHFASADHLAIYERSFCRSGDGAQEQCARLRTLRQTGKPPPTWLLPDGGRFEAESAEAAK